MEKCRICGSADFYKDSGYFFCVTCQTQNEDIREEILEVRIDDTTKLRKTRIRCARRSRTDEELGWTSWELYNFVLVGLTNELIELGAPVDIKVTVLQLWARYLGKLEVAFISTKRKLVPKLARKYKKRDAEIIYGKIFTQEKTRKRKKTDSVISSKASTYQSEGSSLKELNRNKRLMITADYDRLMQSQASSDGDALSGFNQSGYSAQFTTGQSSENHGRIHFNSSAKDEMRKVRNMAKKIPRNKRSKYKESYITNQYKMGPELITPMKLWAILYLALRIHNNDMQLGDMLRYGREGHLSYYKLDHLIPPEVTLKRSDLNFLSRVMDITHKGMRRIIGSMATFLGVTKIICPNFSSLINRYCIELELPRGISLYGERLVALSPPKMKFDKKSYIPNYEGRAMAFIIVILKTLFALDGITEYEVSNFADKVNSAINDESIYMTKLFNFREWQRHIECRRTVLANMHFPTKLKYNLNIPVVDSLYLKFLESINSKTDREKPEITTYKHLISSELVHAMKQCITNVNHIDLPLNEINVFAPSLTPHRSYILQLLEHLQYDLPNILRKDFYSTKVGYMTKPESIYDLARRYEIQLNFIDSNLHFIEKTVPFYEQMKMASIKDLKDCVEIYDYMEEEIRSDEQKADFNDYLHKKIPCQLKIDIKKKQYYDEACNTNVKIPPLVSPTEFIFHETFVDGKLSISDRNDNGDFKDADSQDTHVNDIFLEEAKSSSLSKFCKIYNLNLSDTEKTAMTKNVCLEKKQKRRSLRGTDGKFVKQNNVLLEQNIDNSNEDRTHCTEQTKANPYIHKVIENILPEILDICNLNDTLMFNDIAKIEVGHDNQPENSRKIVEVAMDKFSYILDKKTDDTFKLFRPFKDYWMYRCNFSRVKPKNFELFEKTLPRSFRWLLNECASVVEMSSEDLYEEVCLVEAYYANVSDQLEIRTNAKIENAILKKW
ncbi:PREDICTED: TATA box-binding protein-associated factor RNA polymerase I subunit B [Dinoponera quadriceps]|uniref:TATA box-binding protein-associated factor RNA polymerase I subunit B n=1 Tax=Dinoponera quadriceps TaxID=609295 RepID=A0A6P3WNA7_DINQU|nr:PREDICTED: TATA box-binding protein-associated factor RNA polymerase I subunit B [Dinoponera quadriceps]